MTEGHQRQELKPHAILSCDAHKAGLGHTCLYLLRIAGIVLLVILPAVAVIAITGRPWILFFALLSFGAVLVPVWASAVIYFVCQSLFLRRHHNRLWRESMNPSLRVRIAASHEIGNLNSPYLNRLGDRMAIWHKRALVLWLITYILACLYFLFIMK